MRNPKHFLAFVTTRDDDEESMMPGYYRFFFPLLQLRQQSCEFEERNRTGKLEREREREREYEFGAALASGFRV